VLAANRRYGRVEITDSFAANPQEASEIFAKIGFFPVHIAEDRNTPGRSVYYGYSFGFDELKEGYEAPWYIVHCKWFTGDPSSPRKLIDAFLTKRW
jgi:hypothetical protein